MSAEAPEVRAMAMLKRAERMTLISMALMVVLLFRSCRVRVNITDDIEPQVAPVEAPAVLDLPDYVKDLELRLEQARSREVGVK